MRTVRKVSQRLADRTFTWMLRLFTFGLVALLGTLTFQLAEASSQAWKRFGLQFLSGRVWDPVRGVFGALPFLYGTIVSSAIGLVIATVVGVSVALLLTQYAGRWVAGPVSFLIELMSAIPSVVYGLWGIFVLAPWIRSDLAPALNSALGFIPLFRGQIYGTSLLTAGLILAIMTIPTITAIVRDVCRAVPDELREGALALGATRQEMIGLAVLPFARSGIVGSVMLGLGRALGETMAVTMVIGNRPQIVASLFQPAYSMASVIANEFTEATSPLYLSSLYEIGLYLLLVTTLFYAFARVLVWRVERRARGALL